MPAFQLVRTSVVYNRFWGYRLIQLKGERAAYPFGFGLGYGDFTLEDLQTSSSLNERFFEVRVGIANRGLHQSFTVVQVYAGKASPLASECTRVLVGFILYHPRVTQN
jgi:beta-glucosidase